MSKKITSAELCTLDILFESCEKLKPMDIKGCLNYHLRKLQILVAMAKVDGCFACKIFNIDWGLKTSFDLFHQLLLDMKLEANMNSSNKDPTLLHLTHEWITQEKTKSML